MKPGDAVLAKNLEVVRRKDEPIDRMIRRFSKKVRNDGIIKEFLETRYYEKPSVKKRRKRKLASRRIDD